MGTFNTADWRLFGVWVAAVTFISLACLALLFSGRRGDDADRGHPASVLPEPPADEGSNGADEPMPTVDLAAIAAEAHATRAQRWPGAAKHSVETGPQPEILILELGLHEDRDWYCPVCLALVRRDFPNVEPAARIARPCQEHTSMVLAPMQWADKRRVRALQRRRMICVNGQRFRVMFAAPLIPEQHN